MSGAAARAGLPRLLGRDRIGDAVLVPVLGIGQAIALGIGAFATRDAFAILHEGGLPDLATLGRLAAAGLAAAGLELIARQRSEAMGQAYAAALRHVLYAHLAGMDRREVAGRRLGALSLRFVGDLAAARNWVGRGLPQLAGAAVVLPGAAAVLVLLNPVLAAVAAPPVLLSLAAMLVLAMGLETRHRSLRGQRAGLSIAMMERIAISPELDLLDRTGRELSAMDADGAVLRRNAVARVTRVGLLRLVPQAGAALAGAMMLRAAGAGNVPPGEVAAGLAVLGILMIPLRELADVWDRFCAWRVAREKALSLLARPSARRVIVPRGHAVGLRLDGLVLGDRRIDAAVPAGAVAGVAGPPGSGKSELGACVAGLDRPQGGAVLYDGAAAPLPRIAHVADRPVVIQGSLRRALTLGIEPRPRRRDITRAARRFGLGPLLARLDGLLGRVGEGARTASDGEALRIDLARAALARPDLIVIDSTRFLASPDRAALLGQLRAATEATVLVIGAQGAGLAVDLAIDLAAFPDRAARDAAPLSD
jgi:ABC-type multidrug transport system fused ATPase/permease subunit